MTTRDLAVRPTQAKERRSWSWLKAVAVGVLALPLLLVAVVLDAAMLTDEEDSGGFV